MFVFFVLVTAVALYVHTITYTRKTRVESMEVVEKDQEPLEQIVDMLREENSSLKSKLAGLVEQVRQTEAQFRESGADQELEMDQNGRTLIIFYGKDSITLTDESREVVRSFIQSNLDEYGANNLELAMSASKNRHSPIETISRKVAIARLMNVRNEFLSSGLNKDSIFVKVENPTEIKGQYDWAKLEFRDAR